MSVEDEFDALRLAVIRADDEHLGDVRPMEPLLVQMLGLVRNHPTEQKYFEGQFVRMATWDLLSPPELVPFCMRELRWPEILRAVRARFDLLHSTNSHARYMNYCSHVTRAYSDFVWEDAGMWDYYRAKELVPSVVPALVQHLTSDSAHVIFNALFALEEIGPPAKEAGPAIREFIRTWKGQIDLTARARLAFKAITGREASTV